MNDEHVVMMNGIRRTVAEIRAEYSTSSFQTSMFHQICERLAERAGLTGVWHKVLVNLYVMKSPRAKDALALALFLRGHGEAVRLVHVHDDLAQVLAGHYIEEARIGSAGKYAGPYIGRSVAISVALKALCHRLFRFWPGASLPTRSIVRGWVDVTASMYPAQIQTSTLLLYPFPYGMRRQFRFYRACRAKGIRPRLDGLPYGVVQAVKLLFSRKALDRQIVDLEVAAYTRYADELLALGVEQVHTSDEFEIAALALYEPLMASSVSVVNTAHGIGLYVPYVAYSTFRGFNASQLAFYREHCPQLSTVLREVSNTVLALPDFEQAKPLPPAVVLLDQNFMDYGCVPEARALERTSSRLEAFCAQRSVPYFIKIHPNSKDVQVSPGQKAITVRHWESLKDYRLVFLTINSTAFYDIQGHAPVLIYKDEAFFPEVYFGEGLQTYNIDDLASKIDFLLDEQNWIAAAQRHAGR